VRLPARRRPPSIYEHVRRHVRPDGPGLVEDGEELPDEEAPEGEIRFAPGALEGAFARYGAAFLDEEVDEAGVAAERAARVEALRAALVRLADEPGRGSRRRLLGLFREGGARGVERDLIARLAESPPRDPGRLHDEMRTLLVESGHREEVKWACVVLSAAARRDDADLFRTLGRHPEFTRYAALALEQVVDDPVQELLALLRSVTGWGKTEVAALLLEHDLPPSARAEVVRHGLGVGNALELAVGCRLDELLAADPVDDELLAETGAILDALTWSPDGPEDLSDYPEAESAVERFLELLEARGATLGQLVTVAELRRFAGEEHEADGARYARVLDLCDAILARPEWPELTRAALESPSEDDRRDGIAAARRLGLPLRDYLVRRIEQTPSDHSLWFELTRRADEETMEAATALAERVLPLAEIGSGPALDLGLDFRRPHAALDFLLQELPRYPGMGLRLVETGLRSPVIRQRHFALRAASRWPRDESWPTVEEAVRECLRDPDEEVRDAARSVLAGEVLGGPTDEPRAGEPGEA
jgi:hypothetical protein